ncbi:MAG: cyclic nucleotide-binding domain-containing protein, partial [Gammaproteobacteria bacterium]|nr:cyclic nucleotide-binding domain-containing protein [Gammaproteobacteria bacterium]
QYSYLDLRNELMRKRDHIVNEHRVVNRRKSSRRDNIFLRFEDALVKRLREKDWAAGFLSRYQNRRLSSHLMRDIARILMAEAALQSVREDSSISDDHKNKIEENYHRLLGFFREHISDTRNSFPEFFERFEARLCAKSALVAALRDIEEAHYQGSLTTKVYVYLEERIHHAIDKIRPINEPIQNLPARDLIRLVPLFSDLPEAALDKIAQRARPVNFLEEDTVIGAGEQGDALYVIARGRLAVSTGSDGKEVKLGELGAGEFFGEMALLGDSIRNANVRAISSCSLLRINSKDVMEVAQEHPEISDRLEQVKAERSA